MKKDKEIKNVLLIRPNSTNDKKDTYITFPLGIGYVASVLQKENYNVSVIDLTVEDVDYEKLKIRIKKINPDVIGISALSYSYIQVKKLSSYLNSFLNCKIILGGHLSNHSYEMVLKKTNVDICVIGEGELTIVDLLKNINNLKKVKGIAYKNNRNIIIKTEPREVIENLDNIPFPAYELFDIEQYIKLDDVYLSRKHTGKNKIHKKMSLEAGRGCPFNCQFCSRIFSKCRKRSVDSIISEIKFLQEKYGIDTFWFQDELLFSNKKYMFEFCNKIKGLDIGWYGNARINSVDKEIIKKAKESNCLEIAYGVESGSPKILKNMNKKITPEQIIKTLSDTIKIGLQLDMGLILGYPGENKQTILETLNMFKKIGYPALKFRYITPYPGSDLYNMCIKNGLIKNEEEYLISLGDGSGPYRFRINFTDFSDSELFGLLKEVTDASFKNYIIYLLKHPNKLFQRIFLRDIMNPFYVLYNRIKNPTNYDKARKINKKTKNAIKI